MRILRFEGLNRTAAGGYYSGAQYSRLYTASRKRPAQRASSSTQRSGIPNSPFRDPVLLTENLVL